MNAAMPLSNATTPLSNLRAPLPTGAGPCIRGVGPSMRDHHRLKLQRKHSPAQTLSTAN